MKHKREFAGLFFGVLGFFAVFFLGGRNFPVSVVCAVVLYVFFYILFKPKKELKALKQEVDIFADDSVYYYRDVYFKELNELKLKTDNPEIKKSIEEILLKAGSILDFINEHPGTYPEIKSFMENYMPATIKILKNNIQIQRSALESKEKETFLNKVKSFLSEIENAFSKSLKELYENKLTDSNIEMETLKKSLIMEGLLNQDDFDDIL